MKKLAVVCKWIAMVLLAGTYFVPLWSITLEAPQYPDGLRMDIWLYKIGGSSPDILQNINILNHYIGMKKIEPEAIPELTYLPWILGAFIVFGIVMNLKKSLWARGSWLILYCIFGILAIYDFYLWEYDYGHDLDPNAPIKVEGMAYQPPLIGEKWLLNFRAISWPATGGFMMIWSVILMSCSLLIDRIWKSS